MKTPRPVPGIAQLRPQVSQARMPPIQPPMQMGQQPLQQPQHSSEAESIITESMRDLALEIYARLAIDHIQANQVPEPRLLRELAGRAQIAAVAYFEQLGIKFEGGEPSE